MIEIMAPLAPRTKVRLVRAVARALTQPSRALPTLRGTILGAAAELRLCSFTNERIHAIFATVIEDVARAHAFDATSLLSGKPRWIELSLRVNEWVDITSPAYTAF